jgi:uncharacterized protein
MKTRWLDARRILLPTALNLSRALALTLGLTGCATSPPSSFYTLTAIPSGVAPPVPKGSALSLGVGPVTFPAFLDRPQIVSRDGTNRLALDEFHRWGGSIQDDFLQVWSENLATLLGTSRVLLFPAEVRFPVDFRVSARVLSFEGDAGGQAGSEAILKVRWTILDGAREQVVAVEESSYRSPLGPPGGQEALVAAMSETLGAFSRDVAERLRRLPRPALLPGHVEPL